MLGAFSWDPVRSQESQWSQELFPRSHNGPKVPYPRTRGVLRPILASRASSYLMEVYQLRQRFVSQLIKKTDDRELWDGTLVKKIQVISILIKMYVYLLCSFAIHNKYKLPNQDYLASSGSCITQWCLPAAAQSCAVRPASSLM